jgi:hypothetical protein
MANMLIEFINHDQERDIIGQLLIAYGEIEFGLLGCLRVVLDIDLSTAARIIFRVRGEGARIDVCDALMRPAFSKVRLGSKWDNAMGAAKHCKSIRNQYAHCHWQHHDETLRFANFDVDARSKDGTLKVTLLPIDLDLLEKQRRYFEYALDWLYYLDDEYQKRVGKISNHSLSEPKSIPAPPLHIR